MVNGEKDFRYMDVEVEAWGSLELEGSEKWLFSFAFLIIDRCESGNIRVSIFFFLPLNYFGFDNFQLINQLLHS